MNDGRDEKNQFRIAFDDFEDEDRIEEQEAPQSIQMVDFDNLEDPEKPSAKEPEEARPSRTVERETQEERLKRRSYEMGEEEDQEPIFPEVENIKEPRTRKQTKKADYKTESMRFLIFTIIIALLAIGAIIFILASRGVIGGKPKPEGSSKEPSGQETLGSSSEEKTDEESTEEPSSETEEPTTKETEVGPTEPNPREAVLNNYSNLFVANPGDSYLNVREYPDVNSKILGTIVKNGGGELLETHDDWLKIRSGTLEGYVSAQFCLTGEYAKQAAVKYAEEHVYIPSDVVNVRKGPGTNFDILEKAAPGSIFVYLGQEGAFYKVSKPGHYEAYVSADFSVVGYYLDAAVPKKD
ncbi:MAG: SH3 domain-containing protein [Lachnospiraceae bacterium]|nr:SH3 domain-containing protein [Lachnospiraceae bacterium]